MTTTNETSTKKSTRIDVAPESLRTIAHQEMILAGFSAEVRKPIWDGTYDLEHLQATYETAVGLCRDAAASSVAALAAWARVYPEGRGSEKRLTGGVELHVLDEGAVINAPTGAPFPVVGTKEAQAAVVVLSTWAREHPDVEDKHVYVIEEAEDILRGLVAHRDHLHAQVTDVQARNAELEVENRRIRAYAMGASARMSGQVRSDNPHRIEATDQRTYEQWDKGWKDADKFAERVAETVREVMKYAPRKS